MITLQVGDQQLYFAVRGCLADGEDQLGELPGAAVGEVVAGHRGDDRVAQLKFGNRRGNFCCFPGVGRKQLAVGDVAESAVPAAAIAKDHESRGPVAPALPLVRAGGTAADRMQALLAVVAINPSVTGPAGNLDLEPFGFSGGRFFHGFIKAQIRRAG